jgi:hypothetical protein
MNASRFKRFRTGYLLTAVCLAIGASCALNARGFLDVVSEVGNDLQLPLERIAIDSGDTTDVAVVSRTPTQQAPVAQASKASARTWREDGRAGTQAPDSMLRTPGYERSIDDSKYWT